MNPLKVLFVLALGCCFNLQVNAQDTIALKSGQKIIAPVEEVGEGYILYNKPDENGKPQSKTLSTADIRRINYKNGYVERYGQKDAAKDRIEFLNGTILLYKVVELSDNRITVDAGYKDSTIFLNDIANITYANGYTEKYNERAKPAEQNRYVNQPVIAQNNNQQPQPENRAFTTDERATHERPGHGLKPAPPFHLAKNEHSSAGSKLAGKNGEVFTLDATDNITLGIGFVIDSVSNISNQFYLYDLLTRNPLTSGQKKVIPVLTLRRGVCDYYLTGSISSAQSKFELWERGELKAQFVYPNNNNLAYNDIFKSLYIKLAAAISDEALNPKSTKLSFPELPLIDFASTKAIKYNVLLNAVNYTPPLDNYPAISREYLKPTADIDTTTLSTLLSYSFSKLSPKAKNKNPDYFRYSAALDAYAKILPQYPEIPIDVRKAQIPLYWIDESLKERNASAETIKYLECVYPLYTSNKLKGFFFESSFVDDKAKSAARKAILPLYKRPGPVLTYLQCGKNFAGIGAYDAAIESFSSGLLLVDNMNTTLTFKEFLKASLFEELGAAYQANNQVASAVICKGLAGFHKKLYNSHLYDTDNQSMNDATQKLTGYFENVETAALAARSKKRSATWLAVISTVATVASAYSDGASGASTVSSETVALSDNAASSFTEASDIKQTSISASAQAAEIFNESFGQMVSQMHSDNPALSSERPLFTMDFIEMLNDKFTVGEIANNMYDFLEEVPALKPLVNQYLSDKNANSQKPVTLNDIYIKFGKIELDLFAMEASGKATTEKDLYNYQ